MPNKAQQLAGAALLGGSVQNAELILLHNGLVYHAILIHAKLHNWERYNNYYKLLIILSIYFRALELALKHKSHIDIVLYLRQKYLTALEKTETNNKFLAQRELVS